jgi:hypothetical protein
MREWLTTLWGAYFYNGKLVFEIYNSTFVAGGALIGAIPLFLSIAKDNRKGKKV